MKMQRAFFTALLLTAGLILPAGAEVVHKWVDADGITHYSDAAPLDPGAETLAIEVTAPPPRAALPAEDYYSIARQWQRMHRESLEREKIALEKARVRAAREADRRETQPRDETRHEVEYRRGYRSRAPYPWHGPGHLPRKPVTVPGKYPPGLHPGRNVGVGGFKQ